MHHLKRIHKLRERFEQRFLSRPRVFQAPGRVNLIGEHTDYNEGFVLPAAIGFTTLVAAAPAGNRVHAVSTGLSGDLVFHAGENPQPQGDWTDYVAGVWTMLGRAGVALQGVNLMIDSDVPIGAGLSSSAALEVSVAMALLGVAGADVPPLEIARLCQRAENEFVGARCGIMDQFTACFGVTDYALLLDCRTLDCAPQPLPSWVAIVLCNTMVRHDLATGEYNLRRQSCESAAHWFGVRALRDITSEQLAEAVELPSELRRRAHHVVTENERVQRAAEALRRGDCERFGSLMNESHESLRRDYEVSCVELDVIVEIAREADGVFGARMTGGGFGGCTVNLVRAECVDAFARHVKRRYSERMGTDPDVYSCRAVAGAAEIDA